MPLTKKALVPKVPNTGKTSDTKESKVTKKSVNASPKQVAITPDSLSPSARIDQRIADLADWRGASLSRVRALIHEAEPAVVEEWKWMGTPVWEHHGIVCTGESYQSVVKLTFAKGASLADPTRLFNASLDGKVRRAIDIREGEQLDASAFKALIRAAIALNGKR